MIVVENLTKTYGRGKPAIQDISLTIDRGEFVVIFGPNGGHKQRVGIARMLVQKPKVILADEPIASLDVKMQHTIMKLVSDIAARGGITVVMSLHQLELARQYASRIVGLFDGRVAFDGFPESLSDEIINKVFKIVDDKVVAAHA